MTAAATAEDALTGAVGDLGARFVLHWGEMGARWGVSRTVAQIHALLYLRGRPLHAEEIAAVLQVARSNVSTSLRELQNWDLARVVHLAGDRRDHFETLRDPWELLRVVVRGRMARELDPTLAFLQACAASREFARADPEVRQRMHEMLGMLQALADWRGHALALDTPALRRLAKMGGRLRAFIKPS